MLNVVYRTPPIQIFIWNSTHVNFYIEVHPCFFYWRDWIQQRDYVFLDLFFVLKQVREPELLTVTKENLPLTAGPSANIINQSLLRSNTSFSPSTKFLLVNRHWKMPLFVEPCSSCIPSLGYRDKQDYEQFRTGIKGNQTIKAIQYNAKKIHRPWLK